MESERDDGEGLVDMKGDAGKASVGSIDSDSDPGENGVGEKKAIW